MTTATTPTKNATSLFAHRKLSLIGTVRSEFLKYRSLTTSWVMIIVTVLAMVGLATLAAYSLRWSVENMDVISSSTDPETLRLASLDYLKNRSAALGSSGLSMANMLIASLAVVFIASEYSTRSIQSTLIAVPRRTVVYLAKLLVISLVAFVLGLVSAVTSFYVGQMIVSEQVRMSANSGIVLNWLATAAYFVFMAWLGLGLGALIRNNAGAIVTAVVIVFISYFIFMSLPWDWAKDFSNYLPIEVGGTFTGYGLADDAEIGYGKAGLVLAAWGAVPALLGYLRFTLTDSK